MPTVDRRVPTLRTGVPTVGMRRSASCSACRRALGMIELLTIVAILVIGLAFIVSMARHVRSTSATELTRKRMAALVAATGKAVDAGAQPTLHWPMSLREDRIKSLDREEVRSAVESALRAFARDSSRHLADALASDAPAALPAAINSVTGGVPELNDAWGRPIALMPSQHALIGMAPNNGPFLVSAGPDGRFLTLADNIYSYDLPALLPTGTSTAATRLRRDPSTPAVASVPAVSEGETDP